MNKSIGIFILLPLIVLFRRSEAQSIPQSGLVASYSFSGNVNDATAFSNHGILGGVNLPYLTSDRFGNLNAAIQLGGCGNLNWIRVPNSPSLQFNKKLSVSLWFKQCDFAGMNGSGTCVAYGGWKILYAKAGDAYTANPSIYCGTSVSPSNKLTVFNNNKNCWGNCPMNYGGDTSANCVDTCEWVHLVTVIDSNKWKMYFNGQLVKQKTINVADFSGANSQDLYFGRMFPGNWYPFGGTIDDINIYNRALGQAQIDSLYGNFYNQYSINISPTPAVICNGSSITLNASGALNYSWAPASTLNTLSGPQVVASPTTTSTYILNFIDSNGCTGSVSKTVTVNQANSSSLNAAICQGQSYQGYTSPGIYTDTFQNVQGCDSIRTLNLTVNANSQNTTSPTSCSVYTWPVNGVSYTSSGTYTYTSLNSTGCVHTELLNLTIHQGSSSNANQSACNSYTWPVNGLIYTSSGTYISTSLNANGCLHIDSLSLNIFQNTSNSTTHTECNSYTWPVNGLTYTASGVYTFTSTNSSGCSHNEILNLTIHSGTSTTTNHTGCNTYTWPINGLIYTQTGTYTFTSINAFGCLHYDTLLLIISQSSSSSTIQTACNQYIWPINGLTYTSSGIYTFTSLNGAGCPDTSILNLSIYNSSTTFNSITACGNYTWPCTGVTYTSNGNYQCVNTNSSGCQDTTFLNLIVNPISSPPPINVNSCDSYVWNSITYTSNGVYTNTFINMVGCDSIQTLNLTVANSNSGNSNVSACSMYSWNGITYTASGIYSSTFTNMSLCDSTHTLNLVIHNPTSSSVNVTACSSYTWLGSASPLTNSGVYFDTLINSLGCDSSITLNLTINAQDSTSNTITACDSYSWNGITYTAGGLYSSSFINSNGCDSISTLNLIIQPSTINSSSIVACDNYNWNGINYTIGGSYVATFTNSQGCDSLHTLQLILVYSSSGSSNMSACDSYTWGGSSYTMSGVYSSVFTNAAGCDSLHTLNLTIYASTTNSNSQTACDLYTWPLNGQSFSASGLYTSTSINASGCIQNEILNLTILSATTTTTYQTGCNSYTWPVNGLTYTQSGYYTSTSMNAAGCLHRDTINLLINLSTSFTTNQTACNQYDWPINGLTYTVSGTYTATSLNGAGCIDTSILNLSLQNTTTSFNSITACDNYAWPCNGLTYTTSGSYLCVSSNSLGCLDSTFLNLIVNQTSSPLPINVNACDSYLWNGVTFTSNGMYTNTFINLAGCDSIQSLNLVIASNNSGSTNVNSCADYSWNGNTYTLSGIYTGTFTNASLCDSIHTLNLVINHSTSSTIIVTACLSYVWAGSASPLINSGVYFDTLINSSGCDSLITLNLTINTYDSTSSSITACDSYLWNGITYTAGGFYTGSFINSIGCDSISTLNLTINMSNMDSSSVISCDNYIWNGVNYTVGGSYVATFANSTGCDSLHTLQLNLLYSSSGSHNASACDSYTWDGNSYTMSGVYSNMFTNASGCDSIHSLNLTIHPSTTNINTLTACDQYLWPISGITFSVSGVYTYTSTNANGCIHSEILNLTIQSGTSTTANLTVCNSYTWPINGLTYTSNGTYTVTSFNGAGCADTSILNLTINNSTISFNTITTCSNYTWPCNGVTYTTSGSYLCVNTNSSGCLDSAFLNLIINQISSPSPININACDSYLWNGFTYTASGLYTNTFINLAGCDSIQTLNLTISNNSSGYSNVSSCSMYFWNGNTYTASGIYSATFTNASSCDSIHTLNLLIQNTTSSSTNVTACASYNWLGSSLPLTNSGVYFDTLINSLGCDSLVTLNLTIFNPDSTSSSITACDSYSWNGITYTTSGFYSGSFINSNGCDSIITLNLIVNMSHIDSSAIVSCDSYNWNGINYTMGGTYAATFTNSQGCDSIHTLQLTMVFSSSGSNNESACDSYMWGGSSYTMSGVYSNLFTNASGCDSIHILNLIIHASTANSSTQTACDQFTWPISGQTFSSSGEYLYNTVNANGCPHTELLNLVINQSYSSSLQKNICQGENYLGYYQPGNYIDTFKTIAGCDSIRNLTLEINISECCQFFIPNAFTPNRDGINDEFRITGPVDFETFEMIITNRWGEIVFKSGHSQLGWDGKYKGDDCTVGTYFYLLKYKCRDKSERLERGDLTLLK